MLEADPELAGFDFSPLTPDWDSKQGFYAADEASLTARAQWVRQYLRSRPETEIVVMAHGDILRRITGQQYVRSPSPLSLSLSSHFVWFWIMC